MLRVKARRWRFPQPIGMTRVRSAPGRALRSISKDTENMRATIVLIMPLTIALCSYLAQAQQPGKSPVAVKIGVLSDMSGLKADIGRPGSVIGGTDVVEGMKAIRHTIRSSEPPRFARTAAQSRPCTWSRSRRQPNPTELTIISRSWTQYRRTRHSSRWPTRSGTCGLVSAASLASPTSNHRAGRVLRLSKSSAQHGLAWIVSASDQRISAKIDLAT